MIRVSFRILSALDTIEESLVTSSGTFLSSFFSRYKSSPLFVVDCSGSPLGYLDHDSYKDYLMTGEYKFRPFVKVLLSGRFSSIHVYRFFESNPSALCIPVLSPPDNHLLGAYIRENAEIDSYTNISSTLAMAVLPIFREQVCRYLTDKFNRIYISCSDEEYAELSVELESVSPTRYRYGIKTKDGDIIIDTLFSKRIRESIIQEKCVSESLCDVIAASLVETVLEYVMNRGAGLLFVEGPIKEKISGWKEHWPHLERKMTIEQAILETNGRLDFDPDICTSQNQIICDGIHLYMADTHKSSIEINDGVRKTVPSISADMSVHIYGSCLTYGTCVSNEDTIPSFLQQFLINKYGGLYAVYNHGVRNGKNNLNDLLFILDTALKPGDVVVELNAYSSLMKEEIQRISTLYEFSSSFKYNDECHFLDNTFHTNREVNRQIAKYLNTLIYPFVSNNSNNQTSTYFETKNRIAGLNSSKLLSKGLLEHFVHYLKKNKVHANPGTDIGAVILTANPFTFGHYYLVQQAKACCDVLYVFIVEEDRFDYSFLDRLEMTRRAVECDNVIVLSTGNLLTAEFTFPEYFTKADNNEANVTPIPELHSIIFGDIICRELGISKRFIGEESAGSVTEKYNRYLKMTLPAYGIDVVEVPRERTTDEMIISSSKAREFINDGLMEPLRKMVPQTTIDVILKNYINKVPIRESLWSSVYKTNDHFYKVLNFCNRKAAEREFEGQRRAEDTGIEVPHCIGVYPLSKTICIVSDYLNMEQVNNKLIEESSSLQDEMLHALSYLERVPWDNKDNFWYDLHLKEFENALQYIDAGFRYVNYLSGLRPSTFIHGDMSLGNIGIAQGRIIIYDFQHCCWGPSGWDKAYFAAAFEQGNASFLSLSESEKAMAECAAAIKLGRAIRKRSSEVVHRERIFLSWKER